MLYLKRKGEEKFLGLVGKKLEWLSLEAVLHGQGKLKKFENNEALQKYLDANPGMKEAEPYQLYSYATSEPPVIFSLALRSSPPHIDLVEPTE